ncbi:MAG: Hpt domain-containing protein [Gammaproteobacteria bacterium]|nr:Hpt domain-containing protein [Gammaproteobacteria bacterium]
MSLESLKTIDGIDAEQGLVNCMDDEGLYLSIVGMYVDQISEYLPLFAEHYDNEQWEEYGKLAHSVKGASASVGATSIQEVSAELEAAAKQQNIAVIQEKHSSYIELLTDTLSKLQASVL